MDIWVGNWIEKTVINFFVNFSSFEGNPKVTENQQMTCFFKRDFKNFF